MYYKKEISPLQLQQWLTTTDLFKFYFLKEYVMHPVTTPSQEDIEASNFFRTILNTLLRGELGLQFQAIHYGVLQKLELRTGDFKGGHSELLEASLNDESCKFWIRNSGTGDIMLYALDFTPENNPIFWDWFKAHKKETAGKECARIPVHLCFHGEFSNHTPLHEKSSL